LLTGLDRFFFQDQGSDQMSFVMLLATIVVALVIGYKKAEAGAA
jgi:hypothetical protein